jgi:hypothetical protein
VVKHTKNYGLHAMHLESPSVYLINNLCSQQMHKPTTNSVMKHLGPALVIRVCICFTAKSKAACFSDHIPIKRQNDGKSSCSAGPTLLPSAFSGVTALLVPPPLRLGPPF